MLDETIITEIPPISYCYARMGEQKRIPITGSHARRIVHGALNIQTGDLCLLITKEWNQITHQDFLQMVREHWRGWHLILLEDRGTPHTAEDSRAYAAILNIQLRFLPRATPELNAMDHLWRDAKKYGLGSYPTKTIDQSALALCQYVIDLNPRERLQNAGVRSADFWLTK